MGKPKELFLIWEEDTDLDNLGYYNQFNTLEDAVSSSPGMEIFKATVESIGCYELVTKLVKTKKGNK